MEQQKSIRLAMVQLLVTEYKSLANKANLLARAKTLITEAAEKGAKIVLLPECFNSPYGTQHFATYAEKIPGYSTKFLAELSKEFKIHIIGGSIPEVCEDESIYNTCTVFGPDGEMLGKYRKIHLADINLPGRIAYQESSVLSPGKDLLSFEVGPCKVGVGICYDIRFPELALLYGQQGCNLLVYPSATNMISSAVHWQSLAVARALDNQIPGVCGLLQSCERRKFFLCNMGA